MKYIFDYIILPFFLKNKKKFFSYSFFVLLTLLISSIVIPTFISKIIDLSKGNTRTNKKQVLFFYFLLIVSTYVIVNHIKNIIQNKLLINTSSEIKLKTLDIIVKNLTESINIKTEINLTKQLDLCKKPPRSNFPQI